MSDNRPCQGDAFVPIYGIPEPATCLYCEQYDEWTGEFGGKCPGEWGWVLARDAGVKLEGER